MCGYVCVSMYVCVHVGVNVIKYMGKEGGLGVCKNVCVYVCVCVFYTYYLKAVHLCHAPLLHCDWLSEFAEERLLYPAQEH